MNHVGEIGSRALEHLLLVALGLTAALPIGLTLGVAISRGYFRRASAPAFYLIGLGQTIPSLAVVALAVGIIGVGTTAAVLAIALYSIPPVARNTYSGLIGIEESLKESARGMGMSPRQILFGLELPMALPFIIAGVRISVVYAVSTTALAALVGAGGLGELIFAGIALFRPEMMLAGAVPTAAFALGFDRLLSRIERRIAPNSRRPLMPRPS